MTRGETLIGRKLKRTLTGYEPGQGDFRIVSVAQLSYVNAEGRIVELWYRLDTNEFIPVYTAANERHATLYPLPYTYKPGRLVRALLRKAVKAHAQSKA